MAILIQPPGSAPLQRRRLDFVYDAGGRRVRKEVSVAEGSSTTFILKQQTVFLYDGWNMIAEYHTLNGTQLLRSYEWGMDVSGSMEGAGGVGGLLVIREHSSTGAVFSSHAPLYDGNGNVMELVSITTSTHSARYEYTAFGETISVDGAATADANPFRFSTKYQDAESGWYYYGYRYYAPELGRWASRDPIEERGGINLYGMIGNNVLNKIDVLGLEVEEALDSDCDGPITGSGRKFSLNWHKSGTILTKIKWSFSVGSPSVDGKKCCKRCEDGSYGELTTYSLKAEAKFGISFNPMGNSFKFGDSEISWWYGAKFGFDFKLEGSVNHVENSCDSSKKTKVCVSGSLDPQIDIGGGISLRTASWKYEISISFRLAGSIGVFGCVECENENCNFSKLKWARSFALSYEMPWWLGNDRVTVWSHQSTGPLLD